MTKQKNLKAETPKTIEVVAGTIGQDGPIYQVSNEEGDEFYLYKNQVKLKKPKKEPKPICEYLRPLYRTCDASGGSCGLVVEFKNGRGDIRREHLYFSDIVAGKSSKTMAQLTAAGLKPYQPTGNGISPIISYLTAAYNHTTKVVQSLDHCGWTDDTFTAYRFGNTTIGETDTYLLEGEPANTLDEKGSLEEWNKTIGAWALHSSRWTFAICAALAGPLLQPLGQANMIFNFCGRSGSGKTTALKGAATVYGGPERIETWEATKGATAAMAEKYTDQALLIDELGQIPESAVKDIAYLLGNGKERRRLNPDSSLRKAKEFHIFGLSTSEIPLAKAKNQYSAWRKLPVSIGELVRFVTIPADAGMGLRMLESIPQSFLDAAKGNKEEAARDFVKAYSSFRACGFVGRANLQHLIAEIKSGGLDAFREEIRAIEKDISEGLKLTPDEARVVPGFAVAAFAGEFAIEKGVITAWKPGDAIAKARICFKAWLTSGETPRGRVEEAIESFDDLPESHPKQFNLYIYKENPSYRESICAQKFGNYKFLEAANNGSGDDGGVYGTLVFGFPGRANLKAAIYTCKRFKELLGSKAPGVLMPDVLEELDGKGRLVSKSDEKKKHPYCFRSKKAIDFGLSTNSRYYIITFEPAIAADCDAILKAVTLDGQEA